MSANVESMMSVKEVPWHGLGKVVDQSLTSKEAMIEAGLNWEVEKSQTYIKNKEGVYVPIKGKFGIVRSDTDQPLPETAVGSRYNPLQNKDGFDLLDSIVGTKEAMYETAGSLAGGKKVWMLAKVDGLIRIDGTDDIVDKYILLSNAHDGTRSNEVALTSVRAVCANTLELALRGARAKGQVFKMRHSKNIKDKVEEARETLKLVNKHYENFNEQINAMAKVKMNKKAVGQFIKGLGLDADEHDRDQKKIDAIEDLFISGKGNNMKGVKGSLWALVNGVTEYVDHASSTRVTASFDSRREARLNSAWFGAGRELKNRAMNQAVELLVA